jgi:hypothetical protein
MFTQGCDTLVKPWCGPSHGSKVWAVPEKYYIRTKSSFDCAGYEWEGCVLYYMPTTVADPIVQFRILASDSTYVAMPTACNMSAPFDAYPLSGDTVYELIRTGSGVCVRTPTEAQKARARFGFSLLVLLGVGVFVWGIIVCLASSG